MPRPPAPPKGSDGFRLGTALAAGLLAAAWLFWLSGALRVVPGSPVVTRVDVLFNADASLWLDRFRALQTPTRNAIHPLRPYLWDPLGCATRKALVAADISPPEEAHLLAGRLLNATFAGLGFACLWAAARPRRWAVASVAFGVYLLFSGNVLVAIPEHFGISHGLLSVCLLAAVSTRPAREKATALAALAFLAGGLTVTNGLYPLGCLAALNTPSWPASMSASRRRKLWVALAALGLIVATGLGTMAAGRLSRGRSRVTWYLHFRAVRDPSLAALYALHGLTDPAVAPTPRVLSPGPQLTYEPLDPLAYTPAQAAGALAWAALFGSCVGACRRDPLGRLTLVYTLPWVAFNLLLHNLWGDEFFLYSPHWSWALGAVLLRGAQLLPASLVVALAAPVVLGQVMTLRSILDAVARL